MTAEAHSKSTPQKGSDVADSLPEGTELLRGQFRIERFLNAGGFGMTYLARNSLDRRVVIKECFPSFLCFRDGRKVVARASEFTKDFRSLVDLFRAEAKALARLDHPNIVGVHEVFDDNNTAYMALDFVEGNDLQEVIELEPERLGPFELRRILVAVLGAVSYIHEQGLLHRDISPDNILLDRHNYPILIDFGSVREGNAQLRGETRLQAVKDGYSPHEFYSRDLPHTPASDLYALGATFYYAVTGDPPPGSQTRVASLVERKKDPCVPLRGRFNRFDTRLLDSIDKSLAIVARERTQSARAWLLSIDDESRKVAALEKARNDARIEQMVRDLVIETNTALQKEDEQKAFEATAAREAAKIAEQATTRAKERGPVERVTLDPARVKSPRPPRNEAAFDPSANPGVRVDEEAASTVPDDVYVLPDPVAQDDPIQKPEASLKAPRKRRARLPINVRWDLPPLFVSNPTQLAGKVET